MRVRAALYVLLGIVAISGIIRPSTAHPNGAPSSVCDSMVPGHPGAQPQQSPPPYNVIVPKKFADGGETLRIRLAAPTEPYKGFFVMSRKVAGEGETEGPGWMGKIVPVGDISQVKTVSCFGLEDSALTHTNDKPKYSVEFDWIAPYDGGNYIILATFVKEFKTFWVHVESDVIQVTKRQFFPTDEQGLPPGQDLNPAAFDQIFQELRTKFFAECGKTKGCFGVPENCFQGKEGNCEMFTSWSHVKGGGFKFQVAGKLPAWETYEGANQLTQGHISSGLSHDAHMGSDSVIGCVYKDQQVSPKSYFNYGQQNSIFKNESTGLEKIGPGYYSNGYLMCEFTRSPVLKDITKEIGANFDLVKEKLHIIMARASALAKNEENGRDKLGWHKVKEDRAVSSLPYSLTEGYTLSDGTAGQGGGAYNPYPGGHPTQKPTTPTKKPGTGAGKSRAPAVCGGPGIPILLVLISGLTWFG